MHLAKQGDTIELFHEDGNWKLKKETGFSPIQMTVAAAAACSGYVYAKILKKKRIPYEKLEIEVDYTQNLDAAVHVIQSIDIHFELAIAAEHQEQAEKSLKLVKKGCPVVQSLNPEIQITEHVKFVSN
ncbi:OsmC family protein [Listeria kieliensis]|uniref:Osmotically inducible protein C n=1 Tax=Listeria kieliensis TaxID=1621700 RepID=A0A3D8TTI3_9LIST|nr:OsmC family protein [Listeria kieliensis]RDX02185.1 osmotically inducible protein C [Listeria kieliensis]